MLKNDVIWPDSRRFKSGTDWEPIGFFSECLCNATHFDLMLGFFSSSAISVLCDGFATFLYNGGTMRIIINDILTDNDKKAILVGKNDNVELPVFNLSNIENIKETLSEQNKHFFECLAWLIRKERIEFKIISPLAGGISHTKSGIFKDATNAVSFDGSCNFSRMALVENIESIIASCDWDGNVSISTINDVQYDFDATFKEENTQVNYIEANNIKTRISNTFGNKDLNTLLNDEYRILESKISKDLPQTIKRVLNKAKLRIENIQEKIKSEKEKELEKLSLPHFPYPSGPREYQQLAFENWKKNNQKGIFSMATGTGKTITSLNCLLEIYKRLGYYKAIILVPTITLVDQWEKECRKFNFRHIVKVCSKYSHWKEQLDSIEFNENFDKTGKKNSYIIISTYASYARENICKRLNIFPKKQVLLITDEAHNMGAGQIKKRLKEIPYLRRIGLSATPQRQYDNETNSLLMNFFGCDKEYTYDFPMEEAIDKGYLCRYKYYPHLVRLTPSEMQEYLKISIKLAKYYTYNQDIFRPKDDPILTALLLKRKNIIHKAANKIKTFKEILEKRMAAKGNLKYTLVYVPEGNKPDEDADVFDTKDYIESDTENEHLIDAYTKVVRDMSPTITVKQFTSNANEREAMLNDFGKGKLEVLTSMKCLDEGVDVPRSELAIFCASTGNPRQFIQRRGRILRTHKDKHMAEIHDMVVAPVISESEETYNMERKLLETELHRVREFALMSENLDDTIIEMEEILDYYKSSIFNK